MLSHIFRPQSHTFKAHTKFLFLVTQDTLPSLKPREKEEIDSRGNRFITMWLDDTRKLVSCSKFVFY